MNKRHAYHILAGLAIVLAAAFVFGATAAPLSLAADLGYNERDVCAAVQDNGAYAVKRLEAAGFPHATMRDLEVYQLVHDGVVEAAVQVDWRNDAATCVSPSVAPTARVTMRDAAYDAVVIELTNAIATGKLSGKPGNWLSIIGGTTIQTAGESGTDVSYQLDLAAWGAGWLVQNGGA